MYFVISISFICSKRLVDFVLFHREIVLRDEPFYDTTCFVFGTIQASASFFNTTMDRFMTTKIPKRKTGKEDSNQSTEKTPKRARHGWIEKYATQYKGITTKSRVGPRHAYCLVCQTDYTVDHGGAGDIERHNGGEGHKQRLRERGRNKDIKSMMQSAEDTSSINAEAIMIDLMVKGNIPFAFATQLTQAVKVAFSGKMV